MASELYWKMQDTSGTTADDATANNRDGTYTGSPTLGTLGIGGLAVDLNGSSQYVKSAANPGFEDNTAGTIEGWFRREGGDTSLQTLWCISNDGSTDDGIFCDFRGDQSDKNIEITLLLNGGVSAQFATHADIFPANEWIHFSFKSDGSTCRFYKNQVEIPLTMNTGTNTGQWFASATDADTFAVGASLFAAADRFFNGKISHVRIDNTALTPDNFLVERSGIYVSDIHAAGQAVTSWQHKWSEDITATGSDIISQIRTIDINPFDDNLNLWMNFEDNVADSSRHTNNGIPKGDAFFTTGKSGRGIGLNGTSSYVDLGTNGAIRNSDSFTIEFWFYNTRDNTTEGKLIDIGGSGSNGAYIDIISGDIRFVLNGTQIVSTTAPTLNAWHHVKATYNKDAASNQQQLIIDQGTPITGTFTTAITYSGGNIIGARETGSAGFFQGKIDEVVVYSGVTTSDLFNISDFSTRRTDPAGTTESTSNHQYAQDKKHLIENNT